MNNSTEGNAATSTAADVTMTTMPVTATTNASSDVLTTAATIVAALEEVRGPETLGALQSKTSVFLFSVRFGLRTRIYDRKLLKLVFVLTSQPNNEAWPNVQYLKRTPCSLIPMKAS